MTDQSVLNNLTLTNLYNALSDLRAGKTLARELFPFNGVAFVPRLRELHDQLDAPAGDEEVLRRLLTENLRALANKRPLIWLSSLFVLCFQL